MGLSNKMIQYVRFRHFEYLNNIKCINPSFLPYKYLFYYNCINNSKNQFESLISFVNFKSFNFFFSNLMHFFAISLKKYNINNKYIATIDADWHELIEIDSDDFITKAKNTKFLFISGWRFAFKKSKIEDINIAKSYLKPKINYFNTALKIHNSLKKNNEKIRIIGVHIRQGDFEFYENGKYFYSSELFIKKMNEIYDIFGKKNIKFLIVSNVVQDIKLFIDFDTYISNEEPVVDQLLLSLCHCIIGPPSTFSLCASFFGSVPLLHIHDINKNIIINDFKVYNILV